MMFDEAEEGREALVVSLEDAENAVTGTSLILVDRELYEVIGYMPGERQP
ncbi:hypothetical protein NCCP2331_08660 [Sporosarcina sp. NCCP-2331]|nr:hypothetical protein NCCP2331_08660 [Sporosarcina sp. NCCP-2331]GLB54823.1 hypothetical protein NCCP2378_06080 [Sporosarcina sp. NCCP-2378]